MTTSSAGKPLKGKPMLIALSSLTRAMTSPIHQPKGLDRDSSKRVRLRRRASRAAVDAVFDGGIAAAPNKEDGGRAGGRLLACGPTISKLVKG
jgi:hypothetical protein